MSLSCSLRSIRRPPVWLTGLALLVAVISVIAVLLHHYPRIDDRNVKPAAVVHAPTPSMVPTPVSWVATAEVGDLSTDEGIDSIETRGIDVPYAIRKSEEAPNAASLLEVKFFWRAGQVVTPTTVDSVWIEEWPLDPACRREEVRNRVGEVQFVSGRYRRQRDKNDRMPLAGILAILLPKNAPDRGKSGENMYLRAGTTYRIWIRLKPKPDTRSCKWFHTPEQCIPGKTAVMNLEINVADALPPEAPKRPQPKQSLTINGRVLRPAVAPVSLEACYWLPPDRAVAPESAKLPGQARMVRFRATRVSDDGRFSLEAPTLGGTLVVWQVRREDTRTCFFVSKADKTEYEFPRDAERAYNPESALSVSIKLPDALVKLQAERLRYVGLFVSVRDLVPTTGRVVEAADWASPGRLKDGGFRVVAYPGKYVVMGSDRKSEPFPLGTVEVRASDAGKALPVAPPEP